MDDLQFYPTPKELALRAWSLFKNKHFTRVLEPSAGNGRYYIHRKPGIRKKLWV